MFTAWEMSELPFSTSAHVVAAVLLSSSQLVASRNAKSGCDSQATVFGFDHLQEAGPSSFRSQLWNFQLSLNSKSVSVLDRGSYHLFTSVKEKNVSLSSVFSSFLCYQNSTSKWHPYLVAIDDKILLHLAFKAVYIYEIFK